MLVSQMIENLLNGVSQQPNPLRLSSQAQEQVNGLSRFSDGGPSKRPGSTHVAKLTSTIAGFTGAFVQAININNASRFFLTIADETLRVFDRDTGLSQAILFPHGSAYLGQQPDDPVSIFADTFTDTNGTDLPNHESDAGVSWTQIVGVANLAQIQSNVLEQIYPGSSPSSEYRLNLALPQNDYTVSARVRTKSLIQAGNGTVHLKLRGNGTDQSGYGLQITASDTNCPLSVFRYDAAGATTSIFSGSAGSNSIDAYVTYALRVTGNFLEVLKNGTVILSGTDATGSHPSGRYTSLRLTGPSTVDRRWLVDDWTLTYTPVALVSNDKYRAVTVDNRTFITNRTVKVLRDTTRKAPIQNPQAIIYLEQADYATTYSVTIDGVEVSYETPAGTSAATRRDIGTDTIAAALLEILAPAFTSFTFHQFGSMIRVKRADLADFKISATDGLADNGLVVIKSHVQRTTDLPLRCVDGYVLEVSNGPEEAKDNYWVKFDSQGSDDFRGVWQECSRPGEGIAFDPTTLPHELAYTDEITDQIEARGFPNQPPVSLALPVKQDGEWASTLNGSPISGILFPNVMTEHNTDWFVNLTNAVGAPIRFGFKYTINTTSLDPDDTIILSVAHNDGAASTNWTTVHSRAYPPGLYQHETLEVEIPTALGANWDVRVLLTYASGVTPPVGDKARVHLFPSDLGGVWYFNYTARDVTWGTDTVYPKGTAWSIVVNGSPANYTQTADQTGAQIAAALEPTVEALAGVASSIVVNDQGTAIRISLDAGGLPTVTASGTFSDTTRFWNPDIDLGYTGSALNGKTLKNLSDGSTGVITDVYEHGITVASLTGGVENRIRNGDLIVVVDSVPRFTFKQLSWKDREAGDSITNPWPSIRDQRVVDVLFHRGRLGLLSAGNVVLSEAGVPENLFRTATTDLLDADPIDAKPAASGTVNFHSATEWDSRMLLWTDSSQYELRGEPILTPSSVALPQISRYGSSTIRPLTIGTQLFFARGMERFTRVFEYRRHPQNERPAANDSTVFVPRYLPGQPVLMAGDAPLSTFAILTDSDQKHLFVHSYQFNGENEIQTSWSRWEFASGSTIVGLDIQDGTMALIIVRADGVFLETLELDELGSAPEPLLDRLVADTPTSGTYTLPYSIATDGSQGVIQCVRQDTGALIAVTRPSATTVSGSFSGIPVWFGVQYELGYTFSTLYPRSREGRAETRGRLQLSRGILHYRGSRAFDVEVTPEGRPTRTKSFSAAVAEDGEFHFPIQTHNLTALIRVTNDSPYPSIITGLDWEGNLVNRSRRI